jgi:hypothetical protein
MFRGRGARDDAGRPSIRDIDGVPTLVAPGARSSSERFAVRDLLGIRRIRGLELADDRWQFSFRPSGQIELTGKDGARIAARIRRERPAITVQVHYPDDD